jgi:hypothetical protein
MAETLIVRLPTGETLAPSPSLMDSPTWPAYRDLASQVASYGAAFGWMTRIAAVLQGFGAVVDALDDPSRLPAARQHAKASLAAIAPLLNAGIPASGLPFVKDVYALALAMTRELQGELITLLPAEVTPLKNLPAKRLPATGKSELRSAQIEPFNTALAASGAILALLQSVAPFAAQAAVPAPTFPDLEEAGTMAEMKARIEQISAFAEQLAAVAEALPG